MNKNENEVLKKILLHYINLEYYANGIDEEFQILLEDLQKKCRLAIEDKSTLNTKLQYNFVMRYVKEQVEEFRKKLEERLEEEAEVVMKEEQEFLDNLYNKTDLEILSQQENIGDEEDEEIEDEKTPGGKNRASKAALALGGITLSKLLFAPIDGRDTTSQFVERTAKNITRTYDTAVRSGYLFGQKSEDVANQVDRNMKQISRGIQAGIQTAIPSYAKTTDRIFFKQNNMEVVWCAVLDGKGCIVCYSYNGLHYPSVALAPTIPHNRCRCILCPAKDLKEPIPTYEEYIESLSDEEQYHILGENRYNLWKQYGIELKQFVNNGRKLRLDEIDLPPNLLVENSGARSKIINILSGDDIIKNAEVAKKYYTNIRSRDNKDFISRIAENSGKSFQDIEKIVNYVFKEKHNFEGGIIKYFDASEEIVKAFERLRTKEFTNIDILLLDHELTELTYMKNKKYNIYELAHEMANKKYNWEEAVRNENLPKD